MNEGRNLGFDCVLRKSEESNKSEVLTSLFSSYLNTIFILNHRMNYYHK